MEITKIEGKNAPDFKLTDKDNKTYSISDFTEDNIVIFFYPKDNTPGCTIESIDFSKNLSAFKKLNTAVVGISGGDNKSKAKFCEKQKLETVMLSDTNFEVASKYNVYGEKSFMGKKYMGISRVTFVLDKNRKIVKIFDKVKPAQHISEVIEFIKKL